jgi:hypothetical protein
MKPQSSSSHGSLISIVFTYFFLITPSLAETAHSAATNASLRIQIARLQHEIQGWKNQAAIEEKIIALNEYADEFSVTNLSKVDRSGKFTSESKPSPQEIRRLMEAVLLEAQRGRPALEGVVVPNPVRPTEKLPRIARSQKVPQKKKFDRITASVVLVRPLEVTEASAPVAAPVPSIPLPTLSDESVRAAIKRAKAEAKEKSLNAKTEEEDSSDPFAMPEIPESMGEG